MKKVLFCTVIIIFIQCLNVFSQETKQISESFRPGRVIAAEYTKKDISVSNLPVYSQLEKLKKEKDLAFVAIYIVLNKERSLSIYDYMIVDDNAKRYPCIAIREEGKIFDANDETLKFEDTSKIYTLLFVVQEHYKLSDNKYFKYILKPRLITSSKSINLTVKKMGRLSFSKESTLSLQGNLVGRYK